MTYVDPARCFDDPEFVEWLAAYQHPTTLAAVQAANLDVGVLYLQYVGDLRTLQGDGS